MSVKVPPRSIQNCHIVLLSPMVSLHMRAEAGVVRQAPVFGSRGGECFTALPFPICDLRTSSLFAYLVEKETFLAYFALLCRRCKGFGT